MPEVGVEEPQAPQMKEPTELAELAVAAMDQKQVPLVQTEPPILVVGVVAVLAAILIQLVVPEVQVSSFSKLHQAGLLAQAI